MSQKLFQERANNSVQWLQDNLGHSLSQKTFCILPFSHLSTTTTGDVRLCCRSQAIGSIKKESLSNIWNSEYLNSIRKKLIQGEKIIECSSCWKNEEKGILSLRQGQNIARIKKFSSQLNDYFSGDKVPLPTLEFKLSNRCNLKCKMCSPAASNRWINSWKHFKEFYEDGYRDWVDRIIASNELEKSPFLDLFLSNPNFVNEIKDFSAGIKMMDFAGGEPLIDPLHYKILDLVISNGDPSECILRYSTNLTVLSFEKFEALQFWDKFKEVHFTISIDGFRELNEYIREGTISKNLEKNIQTIKNLHQVTSIKGSTTLSAFNSPFAAETLKYIVGTLGVSWHTSRVSSPDFLDARVWPSHIKETAIKDIKRVDIKSLTKDPKIIQQSERHRDDFISWMESPLSGQENLFETFKSYTRANDQRSKLKFTDLIDEKNLELIF